MDPTAARLYIRAVRLPLPDFLNVWKVATNEEKAMLTPLLLRKKGTYLKSAMAKMTPEERRTDPTFVWIRKTFAQDPPW